MGRLGKNRNGKSKIENGANFRLSELFIFSMFDFEL